MPEVQRVKYIEAGLGALSNNTVVLESFDQPTTVRNLQWQGHTSTSSHAAWWFNWGVYKSEADPTVVFVTPPSGSYQGNYFEPVEHLMAGGTVVSDTQSGSGQRATEWPGVVVHASMVFHRGDDLVLNVRTDTSGTAMGLVLTYTLVT